MPSAGALIDFLACAKARVLQRRQSGGWALRYGMQSLDLKNKNNKRKHVEDGWRFREAVEQSSTLYTHAMFEPARIVMSAIGAYWIVSSASFRRAAPSLNIRHVASSRQNAACCALPACSWLEIFSLLAHSLLHRRVRPQVIGVHEHAGNHRTFLYGSNDGCPLLRRLLR